MSLLLITVYVQKDGDRYSAYSPNLLGVSVTAETREEVERQMAERITAYIESLRERHEAANKTPVMIAKGPLEEQIRCLFTVKPTMMVEPDFSLEPRQCQLKAEKDGLCFTHWCRLYDSSRRRPATPSDSTWGNLVG